MAVKKKPRSKDLNPRKSKDMSPRKEVKGGFFSPKGGIIGNDNITLVRSGD
jgi:hypothetical protein